MSTVLFFLITSNALNTTDWFSVDCLRVLSVILYCVFHIEANNTPNSTQDSTYDDVKNKTTLLTSFYRPL